MGFRKLGDPLFSKGIAERFGLGKVTLMSNAAAIPAWSPADIDGLFLWADLSDATKLFTDTTRTTPVSADRDATAGIVDKSGSTNHLTRVGHSGLYRQAIINGRSVVQINGSSDSYVTPSISHNIGTGDFYFSIVYDNAGTGANASTPWAIGTYAPAFYHELSSGKLYLYIGGAYKDFGVLSVGSPHVVAFYRDSGVLKMSVDGVESATTFANATNITNGAVTIGDDTAGNRLGGSVCDALFYNVLPAAEDRALLDAYLLAKWITPSGLRNGLWSYNGGVGAVRYSGTNDKTYIGAVNSIGSVQALSYNHGTSAMSAPFSLHPTMETDDHDTPSLLVRDSDKKLLAFYSRHGGFQMYKRLSSNAEDISAWGAEVDLDTSLGAEFYSYPTAVQMTEEANDPIYLFYRESNTGVETEKLCVSTSADGGATWAAQTVLVSNATRLYYQLAPSGGNRIDIFLSAGPSYPGATKIFHFYYTGAKYYKSDGTEITASLPLAFTDLTEVVDVTPLKTCPYGAAISGSNPVCIYSAVTDADHHAYRYARWSGSAWVDTLIDNVGATIEADEPYHSPGGCINPDNVNIAYLSKQVSGVNEIIKYVTADNGANWTPTAITSGSSSGNYRPIVPSGSVAGLAVLWCGGTYTDYLHFLTYLKSSPQYGT